MLERGNDVVGSQRGPITLRPGSRVATDGHDFVFAGGNQSFVDVRLMGNREIAMGRFGRTDVVQHLVIVPDLMDVITRVEPEGTNAEVEVVFFPFTPEVFGRIRVGRVILVARPAEIDGVALPVNRAGKEPLRFHRRIVFALLVHQDLGRDHDADAQFVHYPHHGRWKGPEVRV